jgi:hypothetical protein
MICAGTVSTEPKMNTAASTGSLAQPNPVENSIVLPANPSACRPTIYIGHQQRPCAIPRGKC